MTPTKHKPDKEKGQTRRKPSEFGNSGNKIYRRKMRKTSPKSMLKVLKLYLKAMTLILFYKNLKSLDLNNKISAWLRQD